MKGPNIEIRWGIAGGPTTFYRVYHIVMDGRTIHTCVSELDALSWIRERYGSIPIGRRQ